MSVPIARLASLDLIRVFVAVGRRMSITLAAEDLFLTQSTVSRQIRTLEDQLGARLLTRGHRSIAFTPEGDRLFRSADGAVQQLQDALEAIRIGTAPRPVTITCPFGLAGIWLLPRLLDFQQRHPAIDVRIAASDRVEDLRGDGIDLAIRYCSAESAGANAVRLFAATIAPVAHPRLGFDTLDPAVLKRHCLLEYEGSPLPWLTWRDWLSEQGWSGVKPQSTLRFNHDDQVIAAAVAGQGVALGILELLQPLLADGRLRVLRVRGGIRPGRAPARAYWLIKAKPEPRADVLTTAGWIKAEAAATEAGTAQ